MVLLVIIMDMFSIDAPEVPARKAETDDVFDELDVIENQSVQLFWEIREADRTVDLVMAQGPAVCFGSLMVVL